MQRIGAWLLVLLVKLWVSSLRARRVGATMAGPGVAAFWHGDQLPLFGHLPAGPRVAPVSLSRDGTLQAQILARLGVDAVRGSSSRGGGAALLGLVRALRERYAVALVAADGPRGPRGIAKPGAVYLAQRLRVPIWPVGVAVRHGVRLRNWDRYLLPLPFSQVVVVIGEPTWVAPSQRLDEACKALETSIKGACKLARDLLVGNQ